MALRMKCINVFYQLNDFIFFLSIYEEFFIEIEIIYNLIRKPFNSKIRNL